MTARMNNLDWASDRKGEAYGKERRFALLVAAAANPTTPPDAPSMSSLALIAPPQRSPPPMQAVLGQPFPIAKPPGPQPTGLKPPDHPAPIPLLRRIA
jgi:hypothetical protein